MLKVCRSCILHYIELEPDPEEYKCPICKVKIDEVHPENNLKVDKVRQILVFKLVPNLEQEEIARQEAFQIAQRVKRQCENQTEICTSFNDKNEPVTILLGDYVTLRLTPLGNSSSSDYFSNFNTDCWLFFPVVSEMNNLKTFILKQYGKVYSSSSSSKNDVKLVTLFFKDDHGIFQVIQNEHEAMTMNRFLISNLLLERDEFQFYWQFRCPRYHPLK